MRGDEPLPLELVQVVLLFSRMRGDEPSVGASHPCSARLSPNARG